MGKGLGGRLGSSHVQLEEVEDAAEDGDGGHRKVDDAENV